jgi:hypothetical protein
MITSKIRSHSITCGQIDPSELAVIAILQTNLLFIPRPDLFPSREKGQLSKKFSRTYTCLYCKGCATMIKLGIDEKYSINLLELGLRQLEGQGFAIREEN